MVKQNIVRSEVWDPPDPDFCPARNPCQAGTLTSYQFRQPNCETQRFPDQKLSNPIFPCCCLLFVRPSCIGNISTSPLYDVLDPPPTHPSPTKPIQRYYISSFFLQPHVTHYPLTHCPAPTHLGECVSQRSVSWCFYLWIVC